MASFVVAKMPVDGKAAAAQRIVVAMATVAAEAESSDAEVVSTCVPEDV